MPGTYRSTAHHSTTLTCVAQSELLARAKDGLLLNLTGVLPADTPEGPNAATITRNLPIVAAAQLFPVQTLQWCGVTPRLITNPHLSNTAGTVYIILCLTHVMYHMCFFCRHFGGP